MSQNSDTVPAKLDDPSSTMVVHMLLRFLLAVRYRKSVVIASLVVASLVGGLYYATATRYYCASAGMLMMQTGPDNLSTSMTGEVSRQRSMMKTFENVIRSPKVLEGALKSLRPEDRIDLEGIPKERWVASLREKVSSKAIRSTNILDVNYSSKDPRVAVNVVNAIVQSYLDFLDKTHKGAAGQISRVLTQERVELAEKLRRKQDELLAARRRFGDMGLRADGKALDPVIQRAVYFSQQLNDVQRKRITLQASLATIETAVRNGEDLQQHLITVSDAVGQELLRSSFGLSGRDATTRAELEQELLQARADIRAMQGYLGSSHPKMIAKREKIRMAEQYLREYQDHVDRRTWELQNGQLGPRLVQMVRQKLGEVVQQEASLRAQFEEAQARAIDLNGRLAVLDVLEHDVKRLRNLSDVLVEQIASIDLRQDGQEVRAAVINQPVAVTKPISPRLSYVAMLVLIGGLGIGLSGVYLLDMLDDRFRSIEDMQHQLGVPVLSMVRQLDVSAEARGLGALQMCSAPTATESEGFRTLRTALALADTELHRIVISSAEPGDGKTTILANLAVCYAQSEKKTLLIDADLRRPGLTALLDMRETEGLSGVLCSTDDVARTAAAHVQASGVEGLDILPSGPRPSNPAELLAGPRFAKLLAWAGGVYDQILIDSPPALATSDTAVIGRLVDGVVLVVQPYKNRRRAVMRAVDGLAALRIPLAGLVVNRVGLETDGGYYGYHGGYGYGYTVGYEQEEEETDVADSTIPVGIVPRRVA